MNCYDKHLLPPNKLQSNRLRSGNQGMERIVPGKQVHWSLVLLMQTNVILFLSDLQRSMATIIQLPIAAMAIASLVFPCYAMIMYVVVFLLSRILLVALILISPLIIINPTPKISSMHPWLFKVPVLLTSKQLSSNPPMFHLQQHWNAIVLIKPQVRPCKRSASLCQLKH